MEVIEQTKRASGFIEANTQAVSMDHLNNHCIIPVFARDNEPTISHSDFIESVMDAVYTLFPNEQLGEPMVRVSHPIKGRIPEARRKPASELLDHEKTLYWERMAFIIGVESISDSVSGESLELTIGGVRAYNQENLYKGKVAERFKVFIGFKNTVCLNLCIWTNGYKEDLKVLKATNLSEKALEVFQQFSQEKALDQVRELTTEVLTESQFAHLIGKLKMYQHLESEQKEPLEPFLFGDNHLGNVIKGYYHHPHHGNRDGNVSLWQFYNLLTNANKSSYIDTFLERGANALEFAGSLAEALRNGADSWYLN